jgi:hypothetical protein
MAKKIDWKKYNLPAFTEEPSYQEKINETKSQFIGLETSELAKHFNIGKQQKKELEEQISDINVGLAALSQLLVENLKGQDLQKVTLAAGGTVYLSVEVYPSTADKNTVREWAVEQGMSEILTVNYRTLQGIVKERLEDGLEPPPGVEVYLKTTARLLGATGE